jgi:PAS domain S-box-containing protein
MGDRYVASAPLFSESLRTALLIPLAVIAACPVGLFFFGRHMAEPAAHSVARWTLVMFCVLAAIIVVWVRIQMRTWAQSYEKTLCEMEQQKEWFRLTLASIGNAVVVTSQDGTVSFMNAEAERMTGWPLRDAKARMLEAIFRIINEETRNPVEDPVEKVLREGSVVGLANHTVLISAKGTECPIDVSAAPIFDQARKVAGVVLVFHDATETRQAQKAFRNYSADLERKVLERTSQMERSISDLQAFSYTVSHDLRSPLRAMQAYSQCLVEDYGPVLDDTGRRYLQRISYSAQRLDLLIQDVLTYSRIENDRQAIEPIDLESLTVEIVKNYPALAQVEGSIEIRRPLARVMGHASGLTQALSNLLANAVKFRSADRACAIVVSTEIGENAVRIWIEDNGIGIAPHDRVRIFKLFEQVDPKAGVGTGIGLAIVKKAVEKMQGSLGVESVPGEGSRFWIELRKPQQP